MVPAPAFLRLRVHPLSSFSSSTECVTALLPPGNRNYQAASLRFGSPSRHKYNGSTSDRFLKACLRSAHSVSHTLDGLLPFVPCGLISSHCHVQDSVSGIFPGTQPAWLITSPCPHVVKRLSPAFGLPLVHQLLPPRLQGFNPATGPLLPTDGLDPPTTRSPLKFSAPRVILRTPW
jgi:hypothetical protein